MLDSQETQNDNKSTKIAKQTILAAIFVEGGMAILAFVIGFFVGIDPSASILWNRESLIAAFSIGFFATFPMLVLYVVLYRLPYTPFLRIRKIVKIFVGQYLVHCSRLQIIAICALAGVGEELFFRGLIQEGLARWVGGTPGLGIGIFVSAAIFGLLHCMTGTYAIITFLMGIYFSLIFHLSGNILAAIFAHALYDCCVVFFVMRKSQRLSGIS